MAKVKITWTKEAEIWLKDIYDYISQDNRDAAEKVVNGIYHKVQVIASFPQI